MPFLESNSEEESEGGSGDEDSKLGDNRGSDIPESGEGEAYSGEENSEHESDGKQEKEKKCATGTCQICEQRFPKAATNQIYCKNPACQATMKSNAAEKKRERSRRDHAKKQKELLQDKRTREPASTKRKADRKPSPVDNKKRRGSAATPIDRNPTQRDRKDRYTGTGALPPASNRFLASIGPGYELMDSDVVGANKLLPWTDVIRCLQLTGYIILDLRLSHRIATANLHSELMELKPDTASLWQSRVRQGWESGTSLRLDEIQDKDYKPESIPCCEQLVNIADSVMNELSQQMWEEDQTVVVSYIKRPASKHKREFVHADSMVQSDLMAIMPLNADPVKPLFYPYQKMGDFKQGPIARNDKVFQDGEVAEKVKIMQKRFHALAGTVDGAFPLRESLCSTEDVNPGELLVYMGDALHALPRFKKKKPDRFLHFRGKLRVSPESKGGSVNGSSKQADKGGSDKTAGDSDHDGANSTSKQAHQPEDDSDSRGANEKKTALAAKKGGSDKAAGTSKEADQLGDDSDSGGANDKKSGLAAKKGGSNKAADNSDPDGADKGDSVNSPSKHAENPEDAKGGTAKAACRDPDSHGVIDALRVLRYAPPDVLDGAAVHNLIATGYTMPEAGTFYKKRYPDAGADRYESFEAMFTKESEKKKRSVQLDTTRLTEEFGLF